MPENQNPKAGFTVVREDLFPIADLSPRIDGNHTYQSSLVPLFALEKDEEGELPTPGKNFRLLVVWTKGYGCRIFADLNCVTTNYIAGTTIVLDVEFDNDEVVDLNSEQAKALAKWASHVAYDFAALSLRQLSANNPITKELDLPISPFEPQIDVLIGDRDKSDQ